MNGEWDQEVPEDVRKSFLLQLKDLHLLEEVKIPQWLMGIADHVLSCSLHTFCDASKAAYAATVFICLEYNSCVQVQLIEAKSQVAPIKRVTIPRLELLASTIGARLSASIKKESEQQMSRSCLQSINYLLIRCIFSQSLFTVHQSVQFQVTLPPHKFTCPQFYCY